MKFIVILTLALAVVACGGTNESDTETQADAEAPQTSEETSTEWMHDDLEGALALAAETGKPVFIDMYADWCGPCRMLADDYFTRDDYMEVLSDCILVKINIGDHEEMAARYSVQSVPTLILMDQEGTELDRITGVMGSPEEFLPVIRDFVAQGL
ncbi:hypothetical protein CSA37_04185 [Candidatus Fermentibacteria bacterium]|nr:MAG: hypothetical protein CSA37_04185 [Candidatus Fermentibacteria bacterium]